MYLRSRKLWGKAPGNSVAIMALGGYGRRHLCLHSDIDLLVLFGSRIGPPEERFLRGFLHYRLERRNFARKASSFAGGEVVMLHLRTR